MLKKPIRYTDFDGNDRKADFYFNLTKMELVDMNLANAGGLQRVIEEIINEQDVRRIVELMKDIIVKSYGKKSLDGNRFIKSENGRRLADDFIETEAYSELVMEFINDPEKFATFVNGIIPQALADELKANPQLAVNFEN